MGHFHTPSDVEELSLVKGSGLRAVRWVGVPQDRPSAPPGWFHELQEVHKRWVHKAIRQHAKGL